MAELVNFVEIPEAKEIYMMAGWRQWADAGSTSSGLPQYLIDHLEARLIGEIEDDGYYLFQLPGAHHFLRPNIKLEQGYRVGLEVKKNELYYVGDEEKGLVIFLGDEPHLRVDQYAAAFFEAVKTLKVKRVIGFGGVYGAMPYDMDRQISCIYSLPEMKSELSDYAVRFSDYEGGATIGSLLVDRAEDENVEFVVFYAFVPSYDFDQSALSPHGIRIENDIKAWYDLVTRGSHMLGLDIDTSELARRSAALTESMDAKIEELEDAMPELKPRAYIEELRSQFEEQSFVPLDDVWETGFRDLFDDSEN